MEYELLKNLVQRIIEYMGKDIGTYFDEIQGHELEVINQTTNALLTGDTALLDILEEDSDLYNDTVAFMLFDRKRVINKLIKGGK